MPDLSPLVSASPLRRSKHYNLGVFMSSGMSQPLTIRYDKPLSFGGLPVTTRLANVLNDYELVNRGILDTAGAAAPVIALARTPQERREKILDRIIVIGSCFFLAPLHAWILMRLMARANRLPQHLMQLSFQDIQNRGSLLKALKTTTQKSLPHSLKAQEVLRKRLIHAKVNMLVPDLILECLLMGGVGWLTNMFTRFTTGRNRFSGEQRATSQENLEQLHQLEKGYQHSEKLRLLGSLGLSIGMPLVLGFLLKKSLLPQRPTHRGLLKAIRQRARYFDYKGGVWMSMPSLGIVVTSQFFGHLFSARNARELRENAIRETMMNIIFFGGDAAWRRILAKTLYRFHKLPSAEHRFERIRAMRIPKRLKTRWLNITGRQLLAALALNSATLAGAIILNNHLTQKKVESDVQTKLGARL